ncbi:glycosyltransferase family 4 protein [bacterium]|nr:glycosyltransferase family 4 protein [bacterium]
MRILMLEGFDRGNFSTRWRTYCVGEYLRQHGHQVRYYHLLLNVDEAPVLRGLPAVVQQAALRLIAAVRAVLARRWCRWAGRVIVLNVYSSRWLTRYLNRRCGGYVYDTVDFADTEDFIRLHCAPGWRGMPQRLKMRMNYRTFLAYVDNARIVCTNNFHCIEQAGRRGRKTHLFIDPIPNEYLKPLPQREPGAPFILGWTGSFATTRYLEEYIDVLTFFTRGRGVRLELMEGEPRFAAKANATVVPWTVDNFKQHLPHWSVGIAPLPSSVPFTGKFPGKILQYMAAGIPSIVTPKGMATHFITHGETGFYANTADEWIGFIHHFIEHPEDVVRMGRNARADFEARFSLEAQMPAYEHALSLNDTGGA